MDDLHIPRKTWPTGQGRTLQHYLQQEGIERGMARQIANAVERMLEQFTYDEEANYREVEEWAAGEVVTHIHDHNDLDNRNAAGAHDHHDEEGPGTHEATRNATANTIMARDSGGNAFVSTVTPPSPAQILNTDMGDSRYLELSTGDDPQEVSNLVEFAAGSSGSPSITFGSAGEGLYEYDDGTFVAVGVSDNLRTLGWIVAMDQLETRASLVVYDTLTVGGLGGGDPNDGLITCSDLDMRSGVSGHIDALDTTMQVKEIHVGSAAGNHRFMSGEGSPEGVHAADVGSVYLRLNGGSGTTLYVKESGTGDTGWVSK